MKFAHYRVLRRPDGAIWELGRGAMGVTYKAHDKQLRVDVALKVINPAQVGNAKAQALFLREARAAARVHQSNVANVVYLHEDPANPFYAMEFIAGESLRDWLHTRLPLPPLLAIGLAEQVALGLEAIHAQNVVHRDLKPTNLMIVRTPRGLEKGAMEADPATWQLKIIDFGLARAFAGDALSSNLDALTTGFRGTAVYASPEQCQERADLDGRSDLYSLGCILFEMLVGTPPFRGSSLHELLTLHVSRPAPVTQLARLPASLQAVVARLLVKDPDGRFANAAALVKALERCRTRIEHGVERAVESGPASELETAVDGAVGAPRLAGDVPVSEPASATNAKSVPRPRVLLGALGAVVLVAVIVWGSGWRKRTPAAQVVTAATPAAASVPAPAAPSRKSIAVLPFENRSAEKDNAYLADGIHEDILTSLSKVRDLKVVSRDAVLAYKPGESRNLRQIASELGVGSVVGGSVRRSGNRIRVTAQLVDPSTNQNIWAETYDRELTDVLAVQTQISQEIAKALAVSLSPAESQQLAKPQTNNLAAYDEYMRARGIERRRVNKVDNEKAIANLERAVEMDPDFALAYAELVYLRAYRISAGWDTSDANIERARSELEVVRRLQPDSPQVAEAQANFLFRVERKYDEALRILRLAEQRSPNDLSILVTIGNVLRRTGRLEEAVVYLRRAEALAPRDWRVIDFQSSAYWALRRYDDLERVLQRKMILRPDLEVELELELAMTRAKKNNDWTSYIRELQRLDPRMDDEMRVGTRFEARDFAGALEALQRVKGEEVDGLPKLIALGEIRTQLGNRQAAVAAYREAEAQLRKIVAERPPPKSAEDDMMARKLKRELALVCAILGKSEEATRLVEETLQGFPEAMEPGRRYYFERQAAEVFGHAGDMARAIRIYRNQLEVPSGLTRFQLRNGVGFDEFRKDPDFAAMIAEPGL